MCPFPRTTTKRKHRTVIILPCTLVQPPCRSGMQTFAAIEGTEGEQWELSDVPAQLVAESPSYTHHCPLDTNNHRPHELAISHQDFTKHKDNEDGIHLTTSRYALFPLSPQPLRNYYYSLTLRLLMSYVYRAPILDVSRSHTTTQHSR